MNRFTIKRAATRESGSTPEDNAYSVGRKTDQLTVVGVLVIGILLAVNLMLRFADIGATISEYNRF